MKAATETKTPDGFLTPDPAIAPAKPHSPFGRPGARNPGMDGWKTRDLSKEVLLITVTGRGEVATQFSEGEPKPYVDTETTVVTGDLKGTTKKWRVFSGYLIGSFRGYTEGETILARLKYGIPPGGKREGWILEDVTDPAIISTAKAIHEGPQV